MCLSRDLFLIVKINIDVNSKNVYNAVLWILYYERGRGAERGQYFSFRHLILETLILAYKPLRLGVKQLFDCKVKHPI